jgi:hypothetical protein
MWITNHTICSNGCCIYVCIYIYIYIYTHINIISMEICESRITRSAPMRHQKMTHSKMRWTLSTQHWSTHCHFHNNWGSVAGFSTVSHSSKAVLKTVEYRFAALNHYENGSKSRAPSDKEAWKTKKIYQNYLARVFNLYTRDIPTRICLKIIYTHADFFACLQIDRESFQHSCDPRQHGNQYYKNKWLYVLL